VHRKGRTPFTPAIELRVCTPGVATGAENLIEKCFNLKLSGNEVYYTNSLILVVKIMLCSKLHCQKVLN
jgi:hypothetical protein